MKIDTIKIIVAIILDGHLKMYHLWPGQTVPPAGRGKDTIMAMARAGLGIHTQTLITTISMRARVPSGRFDGKQSRASPESRRTKAFLAHHQRADLEEGSVFFRRVGTIVAQSPGSGKSPVVLAESLEEPLGLCPAIVWGAAVEGREIVMLP